MFHKKGLYCRKGLYFEVYNINLFYGKALGRALRIVWVGEELTYSLTLGLIFLGNTAVWKTDKVAAFHELLTVGGSITSLKRALKHSAATELWWRQNPLSIGGAWYFFCTWRHIHLLSLLSAVLCTGFSAVFSIFFSQPENLVRWFTFLPSLYLVERGWGNIFLS